MRIKAFTTALRIIRVSPSKLFIRVFCMVILWAMSVIALKISTRINGRNPFALQTLFMIRLLSFDTYGQGAY